MPSNIDPDYPEQGTATVASVRNNFLHAKGEIEALQASGGGAGVLCSAAVGGQGPTGPHENGTIWINQASLAAYVWFGGSATTPTTGTGAPNNWRLLI